MAPALPLLLPRRLRGVAEHTQDILDTRQHVAAALRRFAVIADVHSNLEALEAVISEVGGDETYCLGDVVGYGASPREAIGLLRSRGVISIRGNHDNAVASGVVSGFNARAAMAALWTRSHLDDDSLDYLRSLPLFLTVEAEGVRIHMTHGSPDDPLWEYVDPLTHSLVFARYLEGVKADVLALGHTHVPFVWQEERRLVFNPGSVGQPRNGDRRASFARLVVDKGSAYVERKTVEYDFAKAARRIRDAGLPSQLAARLLQGA